MTAAVYFFRQKMAATRKERTIALDPQLGLTMADGGDTIDKEREKVRTAVNRMSRSAQSPVFPGDGVEGYGDKTGETVMVPSGICNRETAAIRLKM